MSRIEKIVTRNPLTSTLNNLSTYLSTAIVDKYYRSQRRNRAQNFPSHQAHKIFPARIANALVRFCRLFAVAADLNAKPSGCNYLNTPRARDCTC